MFPEPWDPDDPRPNQRALEPLLRTYEAIHVMAALELRPIDAFVTYDERQAEAAREVGPPTFSPGA